MMTTLISGDSVTGEMPIVLKVKGGKYILPKRIDSVHTSEWFPYRQFKNNGEEIRTQKEQATCDNGLIWSANGWVKVVRVIRHKVKKKIYRVVTQKGIVECTEDHSLIRKNGEYTKPGEVEIGDHLLHRYIQKKMQVDNTYNARNEMQKAFYKRFE